MKNAITEIKEILTAYDEGLRTEGEVLQAVLLICARILKVI